MVVKSSDDVSNIPDDLGLLMIESHATTSTWNSSASSLHTKYYRISLKEPKSLSSQAGFLPSFLKGLLKTLVMKALVDSCFILRALQCIAMFCFTMFSRWSGSKTGEDCKFVIFVVIICCQTEFLLCEVLLIKKLEIEIAKTTILYQF